MPGVVASRDEDRTRNNSVVKFLFIGPGYPGVPKAGHGTGIGTYLYELTQGLTEKGHECHVIVWGSVIRQPDGIEGPHMVEGVRCYVLGRTYWPLIERVLPDSRDAHNLVREARALDARHHFDWIEVENEEGLDIGLQRAFPDKLILRIHTTALQMAHTKKVSQRWAHRYRLQREVRSFRRARRTMTHLSRHADELMRLYPGMLAPKVVPHGIQIRRDQDGAFQNQKRRPRNGAASFLVVGTPDPRKGFDRIRPVAERYVSKFGPCTVAIVSKINDYHRNRFDLLPPYPEGLTIDWLGSLPRDLMLAAYSQHDALFFPSRYESFGFPLIEAAAYGMAIVTSDVGVASELMTGDLASYVIDIEDAEACAAALHAAVLDRDNIAEQMRESYANRYTREAMVERYETVVQGLD